jgi:hypothetical protein
MATMDPQRHQVRPACGQTHPMVTEDRPWTVGVAENPHDPTSYILFVQSTYLITMKKSLHFSKHLWCSIRDLVNAIYFLCPGFGDELS